MINIKEFPLIIIFQQIDLKRKNKIFFFNNFLINKIILNCKNILIFLKRVNIY